MPLAVSLGVARISQVVLLTQFVGDPRGGGSQSFRAADNLGPAAGVVSNLPKSIRIHAVSRCARPPTTTAAAATSDGRQAGPRPATTREREWHRQRNLDRWASDVHAPSGAVDPQGIYQHFTLANLLSKAAHRRRAVGVIAIGDEQQGFLYVRAGLCGRNRRRDGVVDRRPAGRIGLAHGTADQVAVSRPVLSEPGARREIDEEEFVLFVE